MRKSIFQGRDIESIKRRVWTLVNLLLARHSELEGKQEKAEEFCRAAYGPYLGDVILNQLLEIEKSLPRLPVDEKYLLVEFIPGDEDKCDFFDLLGNPVSIESFLKSD